jgi:hypothetical protein
MEHIKDVKARAMKKLNMAHIKWGADQQTLLRIHQMIILPILRYEDAAYGSVLPTTLKTLDPVNHKGVRLALGPENVLHEARISTLAEEREKDTARIAIRLITNESHYRNYVRRIETTPYYLRPPMRVIITDSLSTPLGSRRRH